MGSPTKEEKVLELFFNEPSKHWHFKDIIQIAKISRQQANKWLKRFMKEKLVLHIKPTGKMPYFVANFSEPNYKNRKKLFAFSRLCSSGLLSHLQSLAKAKAVIIFGSYARADWDKESDIDIFIYGDAAGFEPVKFWGKIGRVIEPHIFENAKEIRDIRSGLMKNVIKGMIVKGDLIDLIKNIPISL